MSENALKLPISYVDIDRDEMEYIDGGSWFSSWFFSVDNMAAIFNTIIGDVIPVGGIGVFVAKKGAANAAKYLEGFIVNKMKALGIAVAGGVVIEGIKWALNYFNPGLRLAQFLDSRDASPNNGIVWF